MEPIGQEAIRETLRLTRENNHMLHSMRRNAFVGSLFKFIFYAILFAAPIWFYMTYLSASVDNLLSAIHKIEGTSTAVQTKFTGLEDALRNLQSHLPAFMQGTTASSSNH